MFVTSRHRVPCTEVFSTSQLPTRSVAILINVEDTASRHSVPRVPTRRSLGYEPRAWRVDSFDWRLRLSVVKRWLECAHTFFHTQGDFCWSELLLEVALSQPVY